MKRTFRCFLMALLCAGFCSHVLSARVLEDDSEEVKKVEPEKPVDLPPMPDGNSLLEFYVGPATSNRFFIDPKSISVVDGDVVRYTMVIKTSGGSENVSYEGIRCNAQERRVYAFGRSDGTWVRSRNDAWTVIQDSRSNRQHKALATEYFCDLGIAIRTPKEGIEAIKRERPVSGVRECSPVCTQ